MKRLLAGALLALASCAHGGSSAQLASRPHAPLALVGPEGLSDDQEPVLEDALCQALVESNHGDVSCPSATRVALALARNRAEATGDRHAADQAMQAAQTQLAQQVHAVVTRDGEKLVLTLDFTDSGKPIAHRQVTAKSFEDLVSAAPDAARSLLQ